jgi:hypothetical protein
MQNDKLTEVRERTGKFALKLFTNLSVRAADSAHHPFHRRRVN